MSIWQKSLNGGGGGALMQDFAVPCGSKKWKSTSWRDDLRSQPKGWLSLEWQHYPSASKGWRITQELACWSVEISRKSIPKEEPTECHCRIPVNECKRNSGITVTIRTHGNHCHIHMAFHLSSVPSLATRPILITPSHWPTIPRCSLTGCDDITASIPVCAGALVPTSEHWWLPVRMAATASAQVNQEEGGRCVWEPSCGLGRWKPGPEKWEK